MIKHSAVILSVVIGMFVIPALCRAQAVVVCTVNGQLAECMGSVVSDPAGEYSLGLIRPGNSDALWTGLTSEQAISDKIISVGAPCPTNQNPLPPYSWAALPYTGNSLKLSQTPSISGTFDTTGTCTQPSPRTFYGQKQQMLSCPAGWTASLSAGTADYPFGYCYQYPKYFIELFKKPALDQGSCCDSSSPSPLVAEPINVANGGVYSSIGDLSLSGSITFKRVYSSTEVNPGDLGAGWRHAFSRSVRTLYSTIEARPYLTTDSPSSLYDTPSQACQSGFPELLPRVPSWNGATPLWTGKACLLIKNNQTIGWLAVYTTGSLLSPSPSPVAYDLTRDDGQLIRFITNGFGPGIKLSVQVTGSGVNVTDSHDNVEQYDSSGKLLSITSRSGFIQAMSYDSNNRLSGVSDTFGHQLIFNYDALGHLSTVTGQ